MIFTINYSDLQVRFTFIVPRPKPLLQNWGALVKVFDSRVWILIIAAYFFYVVCYWSLFFADHSQRGDSE